MPGTLPEEADYGRVEKREVPRRPTNDERCFAKAQVRGQSTFTLVAQDCVAPQVICEWIKLNIETCPPSKLYEALGIALKMRDQHGRKPAD